MKQTITILLLLVAGVAFKSQAQITINASDVPIPGYYDLNEYTSGSFTNPTSGANQNWDYSTLIPSTSNPLNYEPETDNFWTSLGVDVYNSRQRYLNSLFAFDVEKKMDHTTNGVVEKGIRVLQQAYDISSFTGNTGDSLYFTEQNIVYSNPLVLIPFPLNSTYNNSQTVRVSVNFTLNAPSFGLNNTPCQQVYYETRKDSALGWGTMRVYNNGSPSGYQDVLMRKRHYHFIDSFYVNGAPAPPTLQSVFSISQGQRIQESNAIEFQRKGSFIYLMRMYCAQDTTCSTIQSIFTDTDNLAPVAVHDVKDNTIASVLYPNPATNSDMKLMIMGNHDEMTAFTIVNLAGQTVLNQKAQWQGNNLLLPTKNLARGSYILHVANSESINLLTQIFQIN